jgi:hypothetical protein
VSDLEQKLPTGAVGAALVSSGTGCFAMGVLAVAGDGSKALAKLLTFSLGAGPLSGVTTVAIIVWLAVWLVLARLWRNRTIAVGRINIVAFGLLGAGLLLTFPPFGDLLIGK